MMLLLSIFDFLERSVHQDTLRVIVHTPSMIGHNLVPYGKILKAGHAESSLFSHPTQNDF